MRIEIAPNVQKVQNNILLVEHVVDPNHDYGYWGSNADDVGGEWEDNGEDAVGGGDLGEDGDDIELATNVFRGRLKLVYGTVDGFPDTMDSGTTADYQDDHPSDPDGWGDDYPLNDGSD